MEKGQQQRSSGMVNSEEAAEDMTPKQEESKHNELFCATVSVNLKDGTTYMDCTGKFPVRSIDGMVTMFVMYDWSSNSILVEPIKNTKDETIITVFKEKIEQTSCSEGSSQDSTSWTILHRRL